MGPGLLALPLWTVLVLPFAKILATSLSIGAGGSPFVVVGMIACFGSVAHAPLSVMLMVAEMTGTLALLPPAMVAVVPTRARTRCSGRTTS
jgi:CIC family chloride channel protein